MVALCACVSTICVDNGGEADGESNNERCGARGDGEDESGATESDTSSGAAGCEGANEGFAVDVHTSAACALALCACVSTTCVDDGDDGGEGDGES